ncbi:MAG TPA: GNAT family N-acetyltransferase [Candidatus Saccharimonadales bacterium]|nr:GNAT family N-acetyltransferase [Candidatus Saccharimonadales bacterium]
MSDNLELIAADNSMKPLIDHLAVGRDAGLEEQLISKSRQPNILRFTPKDAKERFGDRAMLEKWLAKGREIHWLVGNDNELAGIIWYGKARFPLDIELPELPEETFAIRIYEGYSGHGLARPFMHQSLAVHVERRRARNEPITGIWLETDVDNPAALASYTKFGYQEVARDAKRVTMVLPSSQIVRMFPA